MKWRNLRAVFIANNPLCEFCRERGVFKAADVVDHIEPVKQAPEKALDWDNLQSLCKFCHDSVKARIENGKAVGCDVDGVPLG